MTEPRPQWAIPSDIPEHDSGVVIITGSDGRQWESGDPAVVAKAKEFMVAKAKEFMRRMHATDKRDAKVLRRKQIAETFRMLGSPETADAIEALPLNSISLDDGDEPEPDYEALGYPETRVWRLSLYDLDILAYQGGTWRDLFLTLCQEMDADKENQDDVDNG